MERMLLIGTEEISSAANRMVSAAYEIRMAATSIDNSLAAHRQFMDDWLRRLEDVMEKK